MYVTTKVKHKTGSFGRIQSKHQTFTFLLFEMFHIFAQQKKPQLDTYMHYYLLCGNAKKEWSVKGAYLTVISLKAKKRIKKSKMFAMSPDHSVINTIRICLNGRCITLHSPQWIPNNA